MVIDQNFAAVLTSVNGPLDLDGTAPAKNGGGDILYFTTKLSGAGRIRQVFSVGSVVFSGCLPVDLVASQMLENVLEDMLD